MALANWHHTLNWASLFFDSMKLERQQEDAFGQLF